MLKNYFIVVVSFFKVLFHHAFGFGSANDKRLQLSSIYLFSKSSFRLNEKAKNDKLIIIKTFLKTALSFTKKPVVKEISEGNDNLVYDSTFNTVSERLNYLSRNNIKVNVFVSKANLGGSYNIFMAVPNFILISIIFLFLLPFTFSKNRASYALMMPELMEVINLLWFCKKYKIKNVYFFSIYEKDANFTARILQLAGVKVLKITSEVPLTFANKIIITDTLILCFGYQLEEVEAFKETLFYNDVLIWEPEMQYSYSDRYDKKQFLIKKNSLGFYSSAFYLRKILNHSVADIGSYDTEDHILKYLAKYVQQHTQLHLLVFLHPYEKASESRYEMAKTYYKEIFGEMLGNRVLLSDVKDNSTHLFNRVNLGLSEFSTISFERLNLGFKTLLIPIEVKDFPLIKSPFRNICAYTKEELFAKIDFNLNLSTNEFFERNNIQHYRSKQIVPIVEIE